jgi:hypothetical protein
LTPRPVSVIPNGDSTYLLVSFAPAIADTESGIVVVGHLSPFFSSVFDSIRVSGVGSLPTTVAFFQSIPSHFSLAQNYPNPFNPSTTIQYDVPTSSHVLLEVYNLLGQAVATLVDEVKQPGRYAATWQCSNLPSGVYFYRMQAAEFVQTKKLILLR